MLERETNTATKLRKKIVRFSVVRLCSFVSFFFLAICFRFGIHSSSVTNCFVSAYCWNGICFSNFLVCRRFVPFDQNFEFFEPTFVDRNYFVFVKQILWFGVNLNWFGLFLFWWKTGEPILKTSKDSFSGGTAVSVEYSRILVEPSL